MNTTTLLPRTNRLRQLIAKHGSTWQVLSEPRSMPCFNGQLGVQIMSLDGIHKQNVRWTELTTIQSEKDQTEVLCPQPFCWRTSPCNERDCVYPIKTEASPFEGSIHPIREGSTS